MKSNSKSNGAVLPYGVAAACAAIAAVAGALLAAQPARAQECPGKPNAIGTSRVLVLEPGELTQVGVMQYPQSLPLADKEVVLTFDDGPLPPYSNKVLDILAEQCVKATYFLIGQMAQAYPSVVRRIHQEGHTIGTHTEDHPLRMQKLPIEKIRWEIDQGIADVGAALGDPDELAPFIRIPGLSRSPVIEEEAAARSLVIFSSDTVADDWHRHIKPRDIVSRAMSRLEKRGKGILLLHDIHKSTVAALPELLKELKEKGFRVVHVIPGDVPGRIQTVGEPGLADHTMLPVPDVMSFATAYLPKRRIVLADRSAGARYLARAAAIEWPDRPGHTVPADNIELPAPDLQNFGLTGFGADAAPAE
ncbi:MAG: polysaccharide deacetylase family protein [Xanthobacteraceae bacterium]